MKKKNMLKGVIAFAVLASLSVTGCSQPTSGTANNTAQPAQNAISSQKTPVTTTTSTATNSITRTAASNTKSDNVYITVEPGVKLGSDKKLHDAFINGDIKVTAGKSVTLNFYNYDDGTHTMTSPELGLAVKIAGSKKKGEPALTTYTFTPKKEGTYSWYCADPCDGPNKQWAMSQDGYMRGKITVLPASNNVQHVSLVINPDYKLGPDGNRHDAYTPGDFTVHAGQPVELTIINYGKNKHPFVSPNLGINVPVTGRKAAGDPGIFTTTFTPKKSGKYQWNCMMPCDGKYNDWAMAHDNYMMGFITVQ
ncbi:cupredoxin domain-containing protein [Aneurinibacillus terranovensis]|uniref:cupredoxin domain-containing protein n=1 Tax=Aneurinibacillus terranovensis TaxID=278991 RepID=UPI0004262C19|nr:cupredoxin domain-containing protein [Aneurinibacillus terranovensis]